MKYLNKRVSSSAFTMSSLIGGYDHKHAVGRMVDTTAAAATRFAYHTFEDEVDELYSLDMSLWHTVNQRASFFVTAIKRFEVTQGSKALNERFMMISLRRVGNLLFQLALAIRVRGIQAQVAGTVPTGVQNTNKVLTPATNGAQVLPYFTDYAMLAMVTCADFHMGNHKILEASNCAVLMVEELMGHFNHNGKKMAGVHAENAVAPWDDAKFDRTYFLRLQFFFCRTSGLALSQAAIGFHGAELHLELAALDQVLELPTLTLAEAGGTGSTALYGSGDGQASVYIRDQNVAFGTISTVRATDSTIVADIYLLGNIVFLQPEEADVLANQDFSQIVTKFQTETSSMHQATVPLQHPVHTHKLNTRRPLDAVMVVARQHGQKFAKFDCGVESFAKTRTKRIILRMLVELDGHVIFDNGYEENEMVTLWSANQQPRPGVMLYSASQDLEDTTPTGSLDAQSAAEVLLKMVVNKEAFTSTVQNVDFYVVCQFKDVISYFHSMLAL